MLSNEPPNVPPPGPLLFSGSNNNILPPKSRSPALSDPDQGITWADDHAKAMLAGILPAEGDLLEEGSLGNGEQTAPLPMAVNPNSRHHHAAAAADEGSETLLASMMDRQLNFSASAPGSFSFPSSRSGSGSGGGLGSGLLANASLLQDAFGGGGGGGGGLQGNSGMPGLDEDMFGYMGDLDLASEFAGDLSAARHVMNNLGLSGMPLGLQPSGAAGGTQPFPGGANGAAGPLAGTAGGEHPFGEHPSRTLFVRNINWSVEEAELRSLFDAYGEIRAIYTACKHRGFVMVSYYDLRSAKVAMRALQGRIVRRRRLDIHYSIPKDNPNDRDVNQGTLVVFNLDANVSAEELHRVFSQYGEVKEIRETPKKKNHKFVEYFDIRAASTAMQYLNHTEIGGKRIKLEPSRPGGARRTPTALQQQQQQRILAEDEKRSLLHTANQPWNIPAALGQRSGQQQQQQRRSGGGGGGGAPDHYSPYSAPAMPQLLQMAGSPFDHAATLGSSGPAPGSLRQHPHQQGGPPNNSGLVGSLAAGLQQQQQQQGGAGGGGGGGVGGGGAVVGGLSASLQHANAAAAATAAAGGNGSGGLLSESLHGNVDVATLAALAAAQQQQLGALQAAGWPYDSLQSQAALAELQSLHSQSLDLQQQQQLLRQQQQQQPPQAGIPININGSSLPGSVHPLSASSGRARSFSGLGGSSASLESGSVWGPPDPAGSQGGGAPFSVSPVGSPWIGGLGSSSSTGTGDFSGSSQASVQSALGSLLAGSEPSLQELQALQMHHQHLQQQQQHQQHQQQHQQLHGLGRSASAADALSMLGPAAMGQLHLDGLGLGGAGGMDPMHRAASLGGSSSLGSLLNRMPQNPSAYGLDYADSFMAGQLYGGGGAGGGGGGGILGGGGGAPGMQDRFDRQAAAAAAAAGRTPRRSTGPGGDPIADANRKVRKAQQERMFSLDLTRVANGEDHRTTLMIKNIPNKYTQKMLLATIDEQFSRTYDFFYLPIDFKNKCNMGYAFINMVAPRYILPLVDRFNNRKWEKFNSEKVACISYARIQGKMALVTHFQNSSLMHEDKHCRPIIFSSDGMSAGVQEAFPVGPNTRTRAPRASATVGGLPPQPQPIPVNFAGGGGRQQMGSMINLAEAGAEPLSSPLEASSLSTSY